MSKQQNQENVSAYEVEQPVNDSIPTDQNRCLSEKKTTRPTGD